MGDKQPYIPMQNDNTTELGIVKNNVTEKMKAMDKKFHWLWFQNNQVQFLDFWAPGTKIGGGYVTKNHASIHHQAIRPYFLTPKCQLKLLKKHAEQTKYTARVC